MEWEPQLPPGYNDTNRAFLQALMARGTMTFAEGQRVLAGILEASEGSAVDCASVDLDTFEQYMNTARRAVSTLDLDVKRTRHQDHRKGGEEVWALVNLVSDPATQVATAHTPDEIAYIKRLLDAMFDTYNTPRMEVMAVDEAQAVKVSRPVRARQSVNASALEDENDSEDGEAEGGESSSRSLDKGLKHSEVLSLLSSLVAEGWLEKSGRNNFYTLSPRALMELSQWLYETYNEPLDQEDREEWQRIKKCEACQEMVTIGQRCADRDCVVRLHDHCNNDRFWMSRRNGKKCPKCQTDWDGKHYVGERAVTSTQAFQRSRQGRRSNGRRSHLDEVMAAQEEAADDDDDDDDGGE